jgi:hypothetical protein
VKYKVTWLPWAERRLTELWIGSRFASQITSAADWFDANLAVRPQDIGESRPANFRIALKAPMGITFFIDESAKEVTVIRVWLY